MPATVLPANAAADLQRRLGDAGVRYAIANYVDLHGSCKGKLVPIEHLDDMLGGSELYTGAALDGVPQAINDDEVCTMPDPGGAVILPWDRRYAWFPCDLHLHGAPFEACSRNILHRVCAQAAELGYTCQLGIEPEFFVLRRDGEGRPVPVSPRDTLAKPCYDVAGLLDNMHWLDDVLSAMHELGWEVYSFDHEDANGQFEIDFGYCDAVTMADRLTFLRLMLKEMLKPHGYFPSFMPKPFADRTGSGHHLNMSLADEQGGNVFADSDDPRGCGLSELGYHFIGGILAHADAVCCVAAPTVSSYKRLVKRGSMSGSTWAPVFACYGNNNRTNMLRIPMAGGRVECRSADSAMNPYLAAAMIFAAGLEGIRAGIDPGEPNRLNIYDASDAELAARGISSLPRDLGEAVDGFAADPLARAVFGEDMFAAFVDYKRGEWEQFRTHVSEWERARYLEFI